MEVRETKNDNSGTSLPHLSPEGKVRVLTHIQRERESANDYVKLLGGEAKRPLLLFCPPCAAHVRAEACRSTHRLVRRGQ